MSEQISFEALGDVQFHGENDDFGPAGATLRQRPMNELQVHLRYLFTPGTFVGAMVSHIRGGERRIDGVDQDDSQKLTKALFTVASFVTRDVQLIASIGKDLSIRTGIKEDSRVNFRILKLF